MSEDPESALIGELRAIARSEAGTFPLTVDGLTIEISYSGGSSSVLYLRVPYDAAARAPSGGQAYRGLPPLAAVRPMRVRLTPETLEQKQAKGEGIDVEHQTGDELFDAKVYVDAPSPEPLGRLLASQAVRAAVLELFALGFTRIDIDDAQGRIEAAMVSFADTTPPTAGRAHHPTNAFVKPPLGPPTVTATAGQHPPAPLTGLTTLLRVLAGIAFFAGAPLYFASAGPLCSEDTAALPCILPGLVGVVAGGVTAGIVALLAARRLRAVMAGTSSSSARINALVTPLGILVFSVVGTVVALLVARA